VSFEFSSVYLIGATVTWYVSMKLMICDFRNQDLTVSDDNLGTFAALSLGIALIWPLGLPLILFYFSAKGQIFPKTSDLLRWMFQSDIDIHYKSVEGGKE